MNLDDFVMKSAERYKELRKDFPDEVVLRLSFTQQVIDYLYANAKGDDLLKYASLYYSLRQ